MDNKTLTRPGISGSAVIGGKTTLFLDVYGIIRKSVVQLAAGDGALLDDGEGQPTRVLLVDDSEFFREQLESLISAMGYEVVTANDGQQAWELLARDPGGYDIVVTDIEMPRMSGRALCAAVEKEFPNRQFPIFVVTSLTEREHRRWSTLISNLYFVEKPISARKLIAQLHDYLNADKLAAGSS